MSSLFSIAWLVLLVGHLAACDTVVPEAPLPGSPEMTAPATATSGKDSEEAPQWAFPRHIEESRIVFTHLNAQQDSLIFSKINADGTGLTPLSFSKENPGEASDRFFDMPDWSPDGRHIVFVGAIGPDEGHLVLIDSSGARRRVLTPIGEYVSKPRWNPRGDRIFYLRGSFGITFGASIIDTLGNSIDLRSDPENFFFEGDSIFFNYSNAQWLPDGEHLAVTGILGKRQDDPTIMPEDVEVFKVEVDTGRIVERLTHNQIDEGNYVLSPDGQRLVYTRGPFGQDRRIYLMNLSDPVAMPISMGPSDRLPRWADDNRHLIYLKVLPRNGERIQLIDTMHPERDVEVFPDPVFSLDIFGAPITNTGIERR